MSERVGLYARVSTARQEQEQTIASQLEAIEREAEAKGWSIPAELRYVDDGWSGARLDRPALDALRDAAADGMLDRVLIHGPDRLARNYVHQQVLVEELGKRGVDVHFVERPLGEQPEDRLLLQMQGVIAEYERAKITERMRRGRLHHARNGELLPFAAPPYGYRVVRSSESPHRTVVIEEIEADVVRRMFRWVVDEGLSTRRVAQRLNEQGIQPRRAKHWSAMSVYSVLRNPVYTGSAVYNRTETVEPTRPRRARAYRRAVKSSRRSRPPSQWIRIAVPAVIDDALQQQALAQLTKNRVLSPRAVHHDYLLRGLVVCGECGCRMQATRCSHPSKRYVYFYYTCRNRDLLRTGSRDEPCPAKNVHAHELDTLVWTTLTEWLQHPETLATEIAAWRESRAAEDPRRRECTRLEATARRLQQQIDRLVDAYQYGALDVHELKARRERAEAEIHATGARLDDLRAQQADSERLDQLGQYLADFAAMMRDGLDALDFAGRQRLVRLLVERVVVRGSEVTVEYAVPLGGRFCGLRKGDQESAKPAFRAESSSHL
jgi:site-specific DNA recombinase